MVLVAPLMVTGVLTAALMAAGALAIILLEDTGGLVEVPFLKYT